LSYNPNQPRNSAGQWVHWPHALDPLRARVKTTVSSREKTAEEQKWITDNVEDPSWGIAMEGEEPERVVWGVKRGDVLELRSLRDLGYDDAPEGLRGIDVGDPDFWKARLEKDYDRDARLAKVIKIRTEQGDGYLPDKEYNIPPEVGEKGDSSVLVTQRTGLVYGRDWVFDGESFYTWTTAHEIKSKSEKVIVAKGDYLSEIDQTIKKIKKEK
jgi:hypothetical protein